MKVDHLKVRPKKLASKAPCAAEFASVLACWASSQDLRSQNECAAVTKTLRECMATAVCTTKRTFVLTIAASGTAQAGQAYDQLSSRALFQVLVRPYTFKQWPNVLFIAQRSGTLVLEKACKLQSCSAIYWSLVSAESILVKTQSLTMALR